MSESNSTSLYQAVGGHAGLLRLAEAWHERCLNHPIVAHAFSRGFHPDHTGRLAAYWTEALGGPASYSAELGSETEVVRMHSGNGPAPEMHAAGAACFEAALADVGLTEGPIHERMVAWWAESTERLAAYPDDPDDVPPGLRIPTFEG